VLGLPDAIRACSSTSTGVLTQTAKVHAAAWKAMFDDYLKAPGRADGRAVPGPSTSGVTTTSTFDGRPR